MTTCKYKVGKLCWGQRFAPECCYDVDAECAQYKSVEKVKKEMSITIECGTEENCNAVIKMITFMATPKGIRDWKAEIEIDGEDK